MLTACAGLGLAYRGVAWQLAGRRTGNITLPFALARTRTRRASSTGIARLNRRAVSNAAGFGAGLALSPAPAVAANAIDTEAEITLAITRAVSTRGQGGGAARAAAAGATATRARERGIRSGRAAGAAGIYATRTSVQQRGRATRATGRGDDSARTASRRVCSSSSTASQGAIDLAVQW